MVLAALVFLMLGLGFGSVFLPQVVTKTSTQTSIQTRTEVTTLTITTNSSISLVTATVVDVFVFPYIATCTSVNGVQSIVFVEGPGGYTTQTTIYPTDLPHEYHVTLVTASNSSYVNVTGVKDSDTCP